MKVTLTTSEIIAKFGLPDTVELVIENDRNNDPDEWISNVGRDRYDYPKSLSADTRVEVKYRNGENHTGFANVHCASWKETDGHPLDIVAYRILKD